MPMIGFKVNRSGSLVWGVPSPSVQSNQNETVALLKKLEFPRLPSKCSWNGLVLPASAGNDSSYELGPSLLPGGYSHVSGGIVAALAAMADAISSTDEAVSAILVISPFQSMGRQFWQLSRA